MTRPFSLHGTADRQSIQDRQMANMTPQQRHQFQQEAMRRATQAGSHARQHNQALKDLEQQLNLGERLTSAKLEKLLKDTGLDKLDMGQMLQFTLGNTAKNRELLQDSLSHLYLQQLKYNIKKASTFFAGGIRPIDVIDYSRRIDIQRANQQIFMANLFKKQQNVFYFLTNAGPDSKDANHKVIVELLDYPAFIAGRRELPSQHHINTFIKAGKIKFDCDCWRHRAWYRYIATIGKYNYGLMENRYPTTRNPELTGVACKHTLRVMQYISSASGIAAIKSHMKKDIEKGYQGSRRQTPAQIQREAERQADPRVANHHRKRIQQRLRKAFREIIAMPSHQQYAALQLMINVNLKLSVEQMKQYQAYQRNRTPFRPR